MNIHYLLGDNGGVSDIYDMPVIMPTGTKFMHEYGLYEVLYFIDENGKKVTNTDQVTQVMCERIYSMNEYIAIIGKRKG